MAHRVLDVNKLVRDIERDVSGLKISGVYSECGVTNRRELGKQETIDSHFVLSVQAAGGAPD